jgi:hypothetical protein
MVPAGAMFVAGGTNMTVRAPKWFTIIAVLLVLWGIGGCGAFYSHLRYGADAIAGATEYDRRLFASLPTWFNIVYGLAVGAGILGALALLFRSRWAVGLFAISLVAAVVQFGWTFLATDLITEKGVRVAVSFPLLIAGIAAFQLWLARHALRKGWLR